MVTVLGMVSTHRRDALPAPALPPPPQSCMQPGPGVASTTDQRNHPLGLSLPPPSTYSPLYFDLWLHQRSQKCTFLIGWLTGVSVCMTHHAVSIFGPTPTSCGSVGDKEHGRGRGGSGEIFCLGWGRDSVGLKLTVCLL